MEPTGTETPRPQKKKEEQEVSVVTPDATQVTRHPTALETPNTNHLYTRVKHTDGQLQPTDVLSLPQTLNANPSIRLSLLPQLEGSTTHPSPSLYLSPPSQEPEKEEAGTPYRTTLAELLGVETSLEDSYNAHPREITLGGGARFKGTRQRIRSRVASAPQTPIVDFADECADELLQGRFADGFLLSEEEMHKIRQNAWWPVGDPVAPQQPAVPARHSIQMGYHTAWDIGKRGCAGMKLRKKWESSVNPNRLRFFIMDGTDPVSFLAYYGKSNMQTVDSLKCKKGVVPAADLWDALWNYNAGRISIRRSDRGGKLMVIDKLPIIFINAMIICLREMDVFRRVNILKAQQPRGRQYGKQPQGLQKVLRYTSSSDPSHNQEAPNSPLLTLQYRPGSPSMLGTSYSGGRASRCRERTSSALRRSGTDGGEQPGQGSPIIGATRRTAKAMVSPSSTALASLVETTRQNSNSFELGGEVFPKGSTRRTIATTVAGPDGRNGRRSVHPVGGAVHRPLRRRRRFRLLGGGHASAYDPESDHHKVALSPHKKGTPVASKAATLTNRDAPSSPLLPSGAAVPVSASNSSIP